MNRHWRIVYLWLYEVKNTTMSKLMLKIVWKNWAQHPSKTIPKLLQIKRKLTIIYPWLPKVLPWCSMKIFRFVKILLINCVFSVLCLVQTEIVDRWKTELSVARWNYQILIFFHHYKKYNLLLIEFQFYVLKNSKVVFGRIGFFKHFSGSFFEVKFFIQFFSAQIKKQQNGEA